MSARHHALVIVLFVGLAGSVESLSAELDAQLTRLNDIERVELAAFNKRLASAKLAAISVNTKVGTN